MINGVIENAPRALAKTAGFLYLIVIVGGSFAEVFVRQQLVVSGDPGATARNILAQEQLYRAGFAVSVIYLACNIPLAWIFYHLFKRVSEGVSWLVAFFILVGTAIETVNLLNHYAPLILLGGSGSLSAFAPEQLETLAYVTATLGLTCPRPLTSSRYRP